MRLTCLAPTTFMWRLGSSDPLPFISLRLPNGLKTLLLPLVLDRHYSPVPPTPLFLVLGESWLQRKSPGEVSGSSNKAYLHRGEANYTAN